MSLLYLPLTLRGLVPSRNWQIAVLLVLLLVLTVAIALTQGAVALTLPQVISALLHQGIVKHQTIVWDLRLPRVLLAVTVGAALGMAGALLQGLLRNSLAEPFLLGISAGAGLVVVGLIVLGGFQSWIPFAAWAGAVLTTALIYLLAKTGTEIRLERLILGGVAVSSLLGAVQALLLLLSNDSTIQQVLNWLLGSLSGRGWSELQMVAPYVAIALLAGCLLARSINILSLGNDLAVGLGVSLVRSRVLIGGCATLLAASAVSVSGLIGFVGLIVPHGVRLLVGTDYRWVLPLSAISGAWVLTMADLLSRLGALELPVGVVTALLGSPLFISLLYRQRPAWGGKE